MSSPTLAEVRSITPARAVPDEELGAALAACATHVERAMRRGVTEGPWLDELRRLTSTYAPWVARHAVRAFRGDRG